MININKFLVPNVKITKYQNAGTI